jgi:hypothetical protein
MIGLKNWHLNRSICSFKKPLFLPEIFSGIQLGQGIKSS